MIELMKDCYQTEKQNVYEHGLSVWNFYQRLLSDNHEGMKIPDWFIKNKTFLIANLHSQQIIQEYTVFHDIGKTRCLAIDGNGKKHFPNHAFVSEQMWNEFGGCPIIGNLIGLDMIFHIEKPEDIINRNLDTKTLCTLMIAALSELHANANLFGGITSESFCIKYKRLNKRATFILGKINS